MTLVWTVIGIILIYLAVGIGAEFINDAKNDEPFGLDKKSLKRILRWPKHVWPNKKEGN